MKDCTTCKYGYNDEQLGIPMCHHPKRFSEDCVDFNMHEEKETETEHRGSSEIPNDLEEAAENYAYGESNDKYQGFVDGAKWQAEQDKKTIELAEDHAYLAGSLNEREKLMEEALEGVVCGDNAKLWVCNNPPSFILDKFKNGDKVKLIFIKEN